MEYSSLHLLDDDTPRVLLAALAGGDGSPAPWDRAVIAETHAMLAGLPAESEQAANVVSFALARLLAARAPSFLLEGATLTPWEARIDRGIGMLMRPPSRLFIDLGLDPMLARAMPIRLEMSAGMMGGAWVPARLIPQLQQQLDERLERLARRMVDAEMDVIPLLAGMIMAADAAADAGAGLYEALDAVSPGYAPHGAVVVVPDRRSVPTALRERIELAAKPPKEPGRMTRWLRRRS